MQNDDHPRLRSRETFALHGLRQETPQRRTLRQRSGGESMLALRIIAAFAIAAAYFFLLPRDSAPTHAKSTITPDISTRVH